MDANSEPTSVDIFRATSVLLGYPSQETVGFAADIGEGVFEVQGPRRARRWLTSFCDWYSEEPLPALREHYVESIDFSKNASLHLTYHLHGDSRQRGLALVRIKNAYERAGFELTSGELPDFLPLMLEFASLSGSTAGSDPLLAHRESIELVRRALTEGGSHYAELIEAISATLPRLNSRQERKVRRLQEYGPPTEQVGLEPFAPPEVMPTEVA